MAVIGANQNVNQPKWTKPWAFYTALLILTACVMWTVALTVASANLKASFDGKLAQAEATNQEHIAFVERQANQETAAGVAAALHPLLALKGQTPEISDRTLQSVVSGLLANNDYRFVAITDNGNRVLACSDLALIGRQLPAKDHPDAATAKVGAYPWLGSVVLEKR
ncbi:MAG TPA: hypothetical protein VHE55_19260 [Fimbriimonadaceae bacterium]|nr:hypothetical protein [Fimbriimonadaceae bacterium]